MAVGADQHARLSIPEDVVLLQQACRDNQTLQDTFTSRGQQGSAKVRGSTSASVEDADAAVSAVVDLIPPQRRVAVRLDPHSRHGVVEDLVVLYEAQTCPRKQRDLNVHEHTDGGQQELQSDRCTPEL